MQRARKLSITRSSITTSLLVATILALCLPATYADAAWWPFSSSDTATKSTAKKKPASKSTRSTSKPGQSSGVMSNVTSGTKKVLTSPATMFSGDKKSSPPKTAAKATKKMPPNKKGEKPGWFKSMFVKEETPPPKSVNEWMSLPRNDPWKSEKLNSQK